MLLDCCCTFLVTTYFFVPYQCMLQVDIEEVNKPQEVASVLHTLTGPIGQRLLAQIVDCSRVNCSGHGNCQPLGSNSCDCFAGFSGGHCGVAAARAVGTSGDDGL